ncbi:hypothetical protein [Polaribacter sp. IC073]|uniref:hypothetical protein n=1 Tax=Polaribacter sp. IC073 TaxID=2508540 RepID=UPI0011BDBE21|nr:hypothetical protein [Polaribacter sp. IC073]TXD49387.1 hypothetical protein ES045_04795 [Polaribacter sp. IC073]
MIDGCLVKIVELTKEYKSLTLELNKNRVNDATIAALICNLQLRLQLLKRLKKQLKQLKNLNETQYDTQVYKKGLLLLAICFLGNISAQKFDKKIHRKFYDK